MKVNWKHTLYPHKWLRHIGEMQSYAMALGYLLFAWNGHLYQTSDGNDLGPYEEEKP